MPETPEGETKPEETTPPAKSENEQKPQAPVSEPHTQETPEDTNPVPEASQTADQGDNDTAKAKAEATSAKAETDKLKLDLERERMARKYGVPDELIPMLRPGFVEADAKAITSYADRGSSLGNGGLDPTDTDHNPKAEGKRLADWLFEKSRRF